MHHTEEGEVHWDEVLVGGSEVEHVIPFTVTFYKDDHYGADADGNRGIRVGWTEEDYDYPHSLITKAQEKEIDKLIDDEIEMLGLHLEL